MLSGSIPSSASRAGDGGGAKNISPCAGAISPAAVWRLPLLCGSYRSSLAGFILQLYQFAACILDNNRRYACQLSNLQAVALARRALLHFMHKDNVIVVFDRSEVDVVHSLACFWQSGEFKIVGGKQRKRIDLTGEVVSCSPGQGQAVEGACSAPHFIPSIPGSGPWRLFRIFAVSVISTIKVERPPARSSDEPMRVNMRSTMPMVAASAGT